MLLFGVCVATVAPAIGTAFAYEEPAFEPGWVVSDTMTAYAISEEAYATGWLELDNNTYYFNEDGAMVTGWQEINGYSYYFNEDGTLVTGEATIDDVTYNIQKDGKLLKGFNYTKTAYYDDHGYQVFGWTTVDGKEVYFKEDGSMASSEQLELDENTYNFQADGQVLTGWQADEENEGEWFYYNNYGFKAYGWMEIDGEAYYLDDDGHMLYDTEYEGYSFDENGIATAIEDESTGYTAASSASYYTAKESVGSYAGAGGVYASAMAQLGRYQDCTMLVTNALASQGIYYHGWPSGYLSLGTVVSASEAQAGDIIYYADGGLGMAHVAVYAGNGQAVHGGWQGNQTVLTSAYVGSGPVFIRIG